MAALTSAQVMAATDRLVEAFAARLHDRAAYEALWVAVHEHLSPVPTDT
jgi:cobalamin-dependent methionine synthase I